MKTARVTEILSSVGLVDSRWYTPEACERGTHLHIAVHFDDRGELDEENLDPDYKPYLARYRHLRAQMGDRWRVLQSEFEVRNEVLNYLGHADQLAQIDGGQAVIDFKFGVWCPWHAVQLVAYRECLIGPMRLFNVYVSRTRAQLREVTALEIQRATRVWFAALTLYRFTEGTCKRKS